MYEKGEEALKRILELVATCPDEYKVKCFEVLLNGYVQFELSRLVKASPTNSVGSSAEQSSSAPMESHIPAALVTRFGNTAKRLGLQVSQLEALFDFTSDPLALHAVLVPGKNNADKARNVALLAAMRSYLLSGSWIADWQEVKSMCLDQTCYDPPNHVANLKKGVGTLFKSVDSGEPLELASGGVQAADKLLKTLAGGDA